MRYKRGSVKKLAGILTILLIFVMVIAVFTRAELSSSVLENNAEGLSEQERRDVSEKVEQVAFPIGISDDVKKYVEEFVLKRNVQASQINNISQVDFNALPKEVNIENVNDANLAIYQINYNESAGKDAGNEKQLFVITYSTEELKEQGDIIIASDKREILNFGSIEEMDEGFLKTAIGVEGSLEAGYVMMREGSITGISTNLDVINSSSSAVIEVIIYKNGKAISFGNSLEAGEVGLQKDYDIQSNGVVTFEPGDVISAYIIVVDSESGKVSFKSVITMVEITTK